MDSRVPGFALNFPGLSIRLYSPERRRAHGASQGSNSNPTPLGEMRIEATTGIWPQVDFVFDWVGLLMVK
jgi:hypothetical protein